MKHWIVIATLALFTLTACSDSDPVANTDDGGSNSDSETIGDTDNESGDTTGNADQDQGEDTDPPPPPSETAARYRITFNATWSAQTHPLDFPGNPHFSGLVGAVHNEQVQFWNAGQLATDGIELMAETGNKATLLTEVDTAIANGYASSAISGAGIANSPGSVSVEVEVTVNYPEVTLVTMVAPSPDWFVGVHNVSLLQEGVFVSGRTVDLAVYDAGTDSGTRYTSGDIDTAGPEPISLLTSQPGDSPFTNGLPIVGQLVIERL